MISESLYDRTSQASKSEWNDWIYGASSSNMNVKINVECCQSLTRRVRGIRINCSEKNRYVNLCLSLNLYC